MRGLLIAAVAALALVAAPAHAAVERPIVYAIVIDGLDGDRVDEGKAPFVSSLMAGDDAFSTYYQESRSLVIAETNPNHVAMVTGDYTDSSGTPGNGYGVYMPVEENTCRPTGPKDPSKPATLTSGEDASCLEAQTLFEAIKRQGNPDKLVTAAILGKPKLGAIFSGKNANPKERDVDYLWAACSSSLESDDEYCDPDTERNPGTGYSLEDSDVMDEVVRTVEEGVDPPGPRPPQRPDFTFVNLPQVDSAGHAFTPSGAYDTAIEMADGQINRLVTLLKARDEWKRTVMLLLSDHSMDATLEKTRLSDILEEAGIDESTFTVIGNGSAAMLYLSDRSAANRFELLKRMRDAAMAAPQVSEALYREPNPADGGAKFSIDGVHPAWRAAGERTGDLLVMHQPGGAFLDTGESSNPLTDVAPLVPGQHGAPQTRDNFFTVIGGGPFVRRQSLAGMRAPDFDDTLQNPGQAENVDPAPTVMGLFGLNAPANSEGRFLSEAFVLAKLPGRGAPQRPRLRIRRAGGGRGRGCGVRRFRAVLAPKGSTFEVRLTSRGRRRVVAVGTTRTKLRFRVQEGRRWTVAVRRVATSGAKSRPAKKRIDLRKAC